MILSCLIPVISSLFVVLPSCMLFTCSLLRSIAVFPCLSIFSLTVLLFLWYSATFVLTDLRPCEVSTNDWNNGFGIVGTLRVFLCKRMFQLVSFTPDRVSGFDGAEKNSRDMFQVLSVTPDRIYGCDGAEALCLLASCQLWRFHSPPCFDGQISERAVLERALMSPSCVLTTKHTGYEPCLAVGLFIGMEMIVSFPRSGFTGFDFPARKDVLLATKHAVCQLCLLVERGRDMEMVLAVPVSGVGGCSLPAHSDVLHRARQVKFPSRPPCVESTNAWRFLDHEGFTMKWCCVLRCQG